MLTQAGREREAARRQQGPNRAGNRAAALRKLRTAGLIRGLAPVDIVVSATSAASATSDKEESSRSTVSGRTRKEPIGEASGGKADRAAELGVSAGSVNGVLPADGAGGNTAVQGGELGPQHSLDAAAMVSEPHELSRPSRPTSSHSGTGHSGSGISSGHGRHTSGQQTRSGAGDDDSIMRLPAVAGADGHLRVEPPENDCALATDFFSRESLPQIVPPPPAGGGDGAEVVDSSHGEGTRTRGKGKGEAS